MGLAQANLWDTATARNIAREIASINRLFCGPAVVAWIAAVWNHKKGRDYDYMGRLRDKELFPDGPRNFFGKPGILDGVSWQHSLNDILKRETQDELRLSQETHYKYGTLHEELEKADMPIVIRMYPDVPSLHYVTLYKSKKDVRILKLDRIMFFWQDNGLYGTKDNDNPGLYNTDWRLVGESAFIYGAKRVVKA